MHRTLHTKSYIGYRSDANRWQTPKRVIAVTNMWFSVQSVLHERWLINGDANLMHGAYGINIAMLQCYFSCQITIGQRSTLHQTVCLDPSALFIKHKK